MNEETPSLDAQDLESSAIEPTMSSKDIKRAIKHGVFLEYVERSGGKGARVLTEYMEDKRFDSFGDPESWTGVRILIYSKTVWVVERTYHHVECTQFTESTYEQIEPEKWAQMLLDRGVELGLDDLITFRRLASTCRTNSGNISWEKETGRLSVNGRLVRTVTLPKRKNSNIAPILDKFHAAGWPDRVDNPFGSDSKKMSDGITIFNKSADGFHLKADGNGGVRYEIEPSADSSPPESDPSIPF